MKSSTQKSREGKGALLHVLNVKKQTAAGTMFREAAVKNHQHFSIVETDSVCRDLIASLDKDI